MVTHVSTIAFQGIDAVPVDVQVQIAPGMPAFTLVGLPDKAVAESRERVRSALTAIGLALPPKRITINLAPADLPKEGSHYDLPIALGLMAACGIVPAEFLSRYVVLGELSLDGALTAVAGVLPAAVGANAMQRGLICPHACGGEAAWAGRDVDVLAPETIVQLVNHFKGSQVLSRPEARRLSAPAHLPDLKDIKGQEVAKRALEVAAAGGHNMLMVGPPGSGKSMLAERMPSILPPMDPREMLEVSMISSVAGEITPGGLSEQRPFRNPHHSASQAALVGGGLRAKPGEMALAHNGVLFLDELPEFSPKVLDSMRQPMESGQTVIARANHHVTYPSRFQLVAAMNPCKCGRAGEPGHTCRRGARCREDYVGRLSGPLLDRIDVQIEVPAVSAFDLALPAPKETSTDVAARVARARKLQRERYASLNAPHIRLNAQATDEVLELVAMPDQAGLALLQEAAHTLGLTARGYHRVLRVARTLADLDEYAEIGRVQIAEAVSYRQALRSANAATRAAVA